MDKLDFLFEIGVEELPANHIKPAIDFIHNAFIALLSDKRLSFSRIKMASTPRRLGIYIQDLDTTQEDIEIQRIGPSVRIAYDAEGKLSMAALGFLKKNNASEHDIYTESNEKGEFIAVRLKQIGQITQDILCQSIGDLVPQIPFGKRMIWNSPQMSFSRPIRWIVALYGDQIIPLEVFGISSGRSTYGVRNLGLDRSFEISTPDEYFSKLRQNFVIADREDRKQTIRQQLNDITNENDYEVIIDENLLDTVTDMVENPNAVIAEFDEFYLRLPSRIITSTISQNQKYFAIQSKDNATLLNKFVFISNGDPGCAQIIKIGNEKVVKPRLADAMWYFNEDTKVPFETFVPALGGVVFHSKLGSVADKTQRVKKLTEYMAIELGMEINTTQDAIRAAELCKADLVTLMLGEKEFTKLQGYIGREYAIRSKESIQVADAIYEHYLPKGQSDDLPATICGSLVAVADKLDTVCGIIGIGLLPTGSGDPYALRRAANGIVQIVSTMNWNISLKSLISKSCELFADKISQDTVGSVFLFFKQRTEWLLKQHNLDYDIIDSVMHIDISYLPRLIERARALQKIRLLPQFVRLVIGFKRVSNIIAEAKDIPVLDPDLLHSAQEKNLYEALNRQKEVIERELVVANYDAVLACLIELGPDIDSLFDNVLINCDDLQIRQNRYALLALIRNEFLRVADLSLIVVETPA